MLLHLKHPLLICAISLSLLCFFLYVLTSKTNENFQIRNMINYCSNFLKKHLQELENNNENQILILASTVSCIAYCNCLLKLASSKQLLKICKLDVYDIRQKLIQKLNLLTSVSKN